MYEICYNTRLNLEPLSENILKLFSHKKFCVLSFPTGPRLFPDFYENHELKIVYYITKEPFNKSFNWAHCNIKFFLLIIKSGTLKMLL